MRRILREGRRELETMERRSHVTKQKGDCKEAEVVVKKHLE